MHVARLSVVAALALGATSQAFALNVFEIDLNSIVVDANPDTFNTSFTGDLDLGMDGDSSIAAIEFDNVAQSLAGISLSDFTGVVNIDGGEVIGGNFVIEVSDGFTTDTFSATIRDMRTLLGGQVVSNANGFSIDGLTFEGVFSDASFAGLDVSDLFARQGGNALLGNFFNFEFNPDGDGFDGGASFEASALVPLPSAGLAGLAGLGLIAARRRR